MDDMKKTIENAKQDAAKAVEGVKASTEKMLAEVKEQVKPTVEKVKRGTKRAARATKETAEKAARATKRGAKKALRATQETAARAARKAAGETNTVVYVQYLGDEEKVEDLVAAARAAFRAEHSRMHISDLHLYIKPEDRAAYYVVNERFAGRVDF